jgi:hypothetical protein
LLEELISYSTPLDEIRSKLASFSWDAEDPLVRITTAHLIGVLQRYLNKSIKEEDIESWANLIEGRDDIEIEPLHAAEIEECIYELANPYLTNPMSSKRARELIVSLSETSKK